MFYLKIKKAKYQDEVGELVREETTHAAVAAVVVKRLKCYPCLLYFTDKRVTGPPVSPEEPVGP